MKKFYFLFIVLSFLIPGTILADGTVTINLRPSHIDISSDTAQSAVLVTLSGYSKDLVKYRLYNGSNQYNCWDSSTEKYISSTSYGNGPLASGTPSSSTTFWIPFQRGTNNTTTASYRDRIDPYSSNNNTLALPAATEIATPFILSGTLVASGSYTLTAKYIVMGFNGTNLVAATSSYLTSGSFSLTCPTGTAINKIEVRALNNTAITSLIGDYNSTANVGNINLVGMADTAAPIFTLGYPKVSGINSTQADLEVNLDEAGTVYYIIVPDGAAAPTAAEVFAGVDYGSVKKVASGTITEIPALTVKKATLTGLTDKTNYDIYVIAQDDEATPNKQSTPVKVDLYTIAPPDVLYIAKFEDTLYPFTPGSVSGDQIWAKSAYSGNGFAKISGYSGEAKENVDWLISPAINLDTAQSVKFSFVSAMDFPGTVPGLKIKISSNFKGIYTAGEIAAATWTDITSHFALSVDNYVWVSSGEYDLSSLSGKVYIAFIYESTAAEAATWEIDDFLVTGYVKNTSTEQPAMAGLTLYPVPARDVLIVDHAGKVTRAEVFDMSGRMHLSVINRGESRIRLSVGHLNPGLYLLRMATSDGPKVEKFIKE